ncbi:MAG: hypothetical protein ACREFM_04050 [Hypericibacter sp.]
MPIEKPAGEFVFWSILLGVVLAFLTFYGGMELWARIAQRGDQEVLFVSVDAADGAAPESRFETDFEPYARVPLYLVEDGRLYLRSQTSQAFQPFDVRVDSMHWNAAMLTELVRQHPELRTLLPDPDAPGGGIRWFHPWPAPDAPKP